MHLFLDIISPIPEISIFDDNKIILNKKIINSKETRLSENIIPKFIEINRKLNLLNNLNSILVTTGPGSYTSLRVGISFLLGLHFSRKIKIRGISVEDLLNFKVKDEKNINLGMYIESASNQNFICIKLSNKKITYIKLENNINDISSELNELDVIYYNNNFLNISNKNLKQKKYQIKETVLKNLFKIKFKTSKILKPIYISNNQILN